MPFEGRGLEILYAVPRRELSWARRRGQVAEGCTVWRGGQMAIEGNEVPSGFSGRQSLKCDLEFGFLSVYRRVKISGML